MLERPAARTNAFSDTTKSIRVIKGSHRGIQVGGKCGNGVHTGGSEWRTLGVVEGENVTPL